MVTPDQMEVEVVVGSDAGHYKGEKALDEGIWQRIDDLGGIGSNLTVHHVAAHQRDDGEHKKSNDWADAEAPAGRRTQSGRQLVDG